MAGEVTNCVGVNCVTTLSGTYGPTTTDFTWTVNLPSFNIPGYDTLTGIFLDISGAGTSSPFTLTNNASSKQTFGLTFSEVVYIDDTPDTTGEGATNLTEFNQPTIKLAASGAGVCPNNTLNGQTAVPPCNQVSFTTAGGTFDTGSQAVYDTADYLGTPMEFDGHTTSDTNFVGGGGNIGLTQTTNAAVTVTVTYDYTQPLFIAPEPMNMALIGSGLIGLGLLKRKRLSRR